MAMSESSPNVQYRRVSLDCVFTAASLARSWREGRVEPDELLEIDNLRITFRQACQENQWLGKAVGPLPEKAKNNRRTWREERRFRRDLWRRLIDDGDYHGINSLITRLDEREREIIELSEKAEVAESARQAAVDEAKRVCALARAEANLATNMAAEARKAETAAKQEASAARAERRNAVREMQRAQSEKISAVAARKKAEHALAVHVRNTSVIRDKVLQVLKENIAIGCIRTFVCWDDIPKAKLSRAIITFAGLTAPADVLALYVGDQFGSGKTGMAVTSAGIVGSGTGLEGSEAVTINWGWEPHWTVSINVFEGVCVRYENTIVANFSGLSGYLANRFRIKSFLASLDAANTQLFL